MKTTSQNRKFPMTTVTEYNVHLIEFIGMRDFKLVKGVYNLIVSGAIVAMAMFAILEGAEPTTIGALALSGLMVANGISLAEWLAVKQRLEEQEQRED